MSRKLLKSVVFALLFLLCAGGTAIAELDAAVISEIKRAEYFVKQFEDEVRRLSGSISDRLINREEALKRVKSLKERFPDDPDVDALFKRVQAALMRSKGDFIEITPDMLAYRENEKLLKNKLLSLSEELWKETLEAQKGEKIAKLFPTPDYSKEDLENIVGKIVVIEDVKYPFNQFYGITGEYVHVGTPSRGYWFVDIGGRNWLGPYEAFKRYRRNICSEMGEYPTFTVLGVIRDIICEVPQAEEKKTMPIQFGWAVKPIAIHVPGYITAVYDPEQEQSGRFAGEDKMDEIKEAYYTVKDIPDGATPEQVVETFATAIKEKNYKLYLKCIRPERKTTDTALRGLLLYHWDLHQLRFSRDYVAVTVGKAKIQVEQGLDEGNEVESFFLTDDQKADIKKISGPKIERAFVESKAWNENGRQYGSPKRHVLCRSEGGEWRIDNYDTPF